MALEQFDIFYRLFLAVALGALIGIEREKSQQTHTGTDFAGVRTFMLISFLGAVIAYTTSLLNEMVTLVLIFSFSLIIVSGYVMGSIYNKKVGMTTVFSAVLAFIIGISAFTAKQEIPIFLTIVTSLILSFKSTLHEFVYNLKYQEFIDTIKFLIIAFVILPLLKPIPAFGPLNSINLYEVWLMVVFVSGLNYVGYIMIKAFGANKGIVLTGLLGGILSSTAVVSSLAAKSKEYKGNIIPLVLASAIASTTMFVRVLLEVSILNFSIVQKLAFPMILLALAGYLSVSVMWQKKSKIEHHIDFKSPLLLKPALKFGLFYGFILVISNMFDIYFGSKGVLIASFISGIADVDAITIFIARSPSVSAAIGVTAITLAAVVNTIMKTFIAKLMGTKEYGNTMIKAMAPVIIIGIVLLMLF